MTLMPLKDVKPGESTYTQLSSRVLAVLVRTQVGFAVYVDAVVGNRHHAEWQAVRDHGDLIDRETAVAICKNRFHPGIDPGDLPYGDD